MPTLNLGVTYPGGMSPLLTRAAGLEAPPFPVTARGPRARRQQCGVTPSTGRARNDMP